MKRYEEKMEQNELNKKYELERKVEKAKQQNKQIKKWLDDFEELKQRDMLDWMQVFAVNEQKWKQALKHHAEEMAEWIKVCKEMNRAWVDEYNRNTWIEEKWNNNKLNQKLEHAWEMWEAC